MAKANAADDNSKMFEAAQPLQAPRVYGPVIEPAKLPPAEEMGRLIPLKREEVKKAVETCEGDIRLNIQPSDFPEVICRYNASLEEGALSVNLNMTNVPFHNSQNVIIEDIKIDLKELHAATNPEKYIAETLLKELQARLDELTEYQRRDYFQDYERRKNVRDMAISPPPFKKVELEKTYKIGKYEKGKIIPVDGQMYDRRTIVSSSKFELNQIAKHILRTFKI